jgi:hypothetical protein
MNELTADASGAASSWPARGWRRTGPIASTISATIHRQSGASGQATADGPSSTQPIVQNTRGDSPALSRCAPQIRDTITDCADLDVNRATFQNPFLPLIKVRVGRLRIIAAHDRRHLWQAEQVETAAGFPT